MAQFPAADPTFTTKTDGVDDVQAAHINAVQDEVAAIGAAARTYGALSTYAPTWTGATSNPAIGDGTLSGWYTRIGKTVWYQVYVSFGSTTTMGSGVWSWALPSAASPIGGGCGRAVDAGTGVSVGAAFIVAGASTVSVVADGRNAGMGATEPFTWANGDSLLITGWYWEA